MDHQTREQKEAAIKGATLFMWGSVVLTVVLLPILISIGFFPSDNLTLWVGLALAAMVWNTFVCRAAIAKLRRSFDEPESQ